jgi:hypothetical protein
MEEKGPLFLGEILLLSALDACSGRVKGGSRVAIRRFVLGWLPFPLLLTFSRAQPILRGGGIHRLLLPLRSLPN